MNGQSRAVGAPEGWADPTITVPRAGVWRRALPLLAWFGCLGLGIGLLLALGDGRLAAPSLSSPSTWAGWARGRDPVEVAMVVARLVGLGLSWYLVGVTTVSVLARALRAARLVRVADALSVGPVRVLVQQALGIGLATGVLVSAVPADPTRPAERLPAAATEVEVIAPRSGAGDPRAAVPVTHHAATGTVEMLAPIPAPARPTTATSTPSPAPTSAPSAVPPLAPSAVPAPAPTGTAVPDAHGEDGRAGTAREVRVRPGDHFWVLAERDLSAHLGRPATDAEVAVHWRATVTANRDRLRVPDNPDLLLPGQVVVLPALGEVAP